MPERQYLCIDQKSFYATVECVARGLDPMKTNLVVAVGKYDLPGCFTFHEGTGR